MVDFGNTLRQYTSGRNAHGCTTEEILALMHRHNVTLPESYVTFLHEMGRGAVGFLSGTDWEFPILDNLQIAAKKLFDEPHLPPPALGSFAIALHQGYMLYYINEDGSVWYYRAGDPCPHFGWQSFEDFFSEAIHN